LSRVLYARTALMTCCSNCSTTSTTATHRPRPHHNTDTGTWKKIVLTKTQAANHTADAVSTQKLRKRSQVCCKEQRYIKFSTACNAGATSASADSTARHRVDGV
jgi:hypothetical protein